MAVAVVAAGFAVWLSYPDGAVRVTAPDAPTSPPTPSERTICVGQGLQCPATELIDLLAVRPEDRSADYRRKEWKHWSTAYGSCDAKEALLRKQGTDVQVDSDCEVESGRWVSPWDAEVHTDPFELTVDHVVALSEAVDSGAADWTPAQREAFANDPENLVAVTAAVSRSKGDADAAEWLPRAAAECRFATTVITVKHAAGLAVDQAEQAALRSALNTCRSDRPGG